MKGYHLMFREIWYIQNDSLHNMAPEILLNIVHKKFEVFIVV